MDALLAAAAAAAAAAGGDAPRIVLVPTAVARHRPDLAAANGERAFRAAATRADVEVRVEVASVLAPRDAADAEACAVLASAHLVHLPGGDPDLVPAVLRDTPAWSAILRAHSRGACVAGASAGAMALGARLWTPDGPADGLGLVPGIAVLPHFSPGRLAAWRTQVEPDGPQLTWVGLDERTLVIGHPGDDRWQVAGAGRVHVFAPRGAGPSVVAGHGSLVTIA